MQCDEREKYEILNKFKIIIGSICINEKEQRKIKYNLKTSRIKYRSILQNLPIKPTYAF